MSRIWLSSDHSVSFVVKDTKILLDGDAKKILLLAKIVNQEGYKHAKYTINVKTSAQLQYEQTSADLKAAARAAFLVGSFIPFPPVQIACAVGSVAMDLYDAKEAADRGDTAARNWNIAFACMDAIPLIKAVNGFSRVGNLAKAGASKVGTFAEKNAAKAGQMAEKAITRAGEVADAGLARAGELAGAIGESKLGQALRPAGTAAVDMMETFRSWAGNSKVVLGAQKIGAQVIEKGRRAIPDFVTAHPRLISDLNKGRRLAIKAGARGFEAGHDLAIKGAEMGRDVWEAGGKYAAKVRDMAAKAGNIAEKAGDFAKPGIEKVQAVLTSKPSKVIRVTGAGLANYQYNDARNRNKLKEDLNKNKVVEKK
ncbi:hypothetical protein SELR_08420 [Selenomonas ruminantium subsp. lactilytica TAM6421]|uniref:Uncharacterized protein n=1 Tax=Selenomonas ruminantium subsp. lactilytica (strain NBRC 103574 / TAM6421) TaxID=927704 RepID=I0GP63_SELRL|nr:hypothetical protein [Selenomonas ruminantium]BAL82550.1 hypothetical protein SELR_08420 [Selenomonas ruminantium subsp. lactilytica TAM6421]